MIEIALTRKSDGRFCSCSASGHAGYASAGHDIVCAGVSSLLRTVLSLLESDAGVSLVTDSSERGVLAFRVQSNGKASDALLVHCYDFLDRGLSLMEKDYPDNVRLRVQTV